MQKKNNTILYSASDIVNFLDCEHITTLDCIDLETPLPKAEDDEEAMLLYTRGLEHESSYLEYVKQNVSGFVDISPEKGDIDNAVNKTIEAIHSGVESVYQATLAEGCFMGHADFLRRISTPSSLENFSYEVIDTKLSRKAKAKYIVQLCFYSELLARIQGREPAKMHVVLGDRREEGFRYADYSQYYRSLKKRFIDKGEGGLSQTYPEMCERCDSCRWRNLCSERWIQDDHLNQVANITRTQIKKFQEYGIVTLERLAHLNKNIRVPGISPETTARLCHQASLQLEKRQTGRNHVELLTSDPETKTGFARLPRPDKGDIFFDMEGDPFEDDGLEYLFGVYFFKAEKPSFMPFWAHTRAEEKKAFEQFMDFVSERLRKYPDAHIYHYGHYEETALKKLMSLHGVRESEVDNLLRFGKLVDLYKIVREGLRISEPAYSLKNVEHFYLGTRTGEVKDAGASIVYYERWKKTLDAELLKKIEEYNKDDVRSTYELRQWLLSLRPQNLPWSNAVIDTAKQQHDITALNEEEMRLVRYRELLVDSLPENLNDWTSPHYLKELTYQLLDFHRRANKPAWWALFSRQDMMEEDLIEDVEAIGGMIQTLGNPPYQVKRSLAYTYSYPEQETKLRTGDVCAITDTLENVNNVVIDEENRTVTFAYPLKKGELPKKVSIGRRGPLSTKPLKEAIFRFADNLITDDRKYRVLEDIINQELPRINNHQPDTAIIDESLEALPQIIESVSSLDHSYLFIQGPPGSGKTYTASHIIVELIRRGYHIGVSSNSHKAINNLLASIEKVAADNNLKFHGAKKSTADEDSEINGNLIEDVFENQDIFNGNWQLIAGTAWLFSDEALDQKLDFLFIDEAGQVALANLIAMGTSAKNIILIGDQMQLSQPIQGAHPGRSGESSLDYLLNGMATIPPERGIFLNTTWRMHPDVCRFISEAVYDGRLKPEESNKMQCLVLGKDARLILKPTGVIYVPVEHDACSQRSPAEAQIVKEIYENLLEQHYHNKKGRKLPVIDENILVVAPYNMQVNLLKRILPKGARVGTVDKFQGQEAEVVIVSLATSSGDYLPRHIEFLYSKNRLNVALSRAKCLVILVANPALMAIRCNTIEQMALVNTLCWVKDYSDEGHNKPLRKT